MPVAALSRTRVPSNQTVRRCCCSCRPRRAGPHPCTCGRAPVLQRCGMSTGLACMSHASDISAPAGLPASVEVAHLRHRNSALGDAMLASCPPRVWRPPWPARAARLPSSTMPRRPARQPSLVRSLSASSDAPARCWFATTHLLRGVAHRHRTGGAAPSPAASAECAGTPNLPGRPCGLPSYDCSPPCASVIWWNLSWSAASGGARGRASGWPPPASIARFSFPCQGYTFINGHRHDVAVHL